MLDVSVIIVNYNTSAVLEDCLASVYAKTEGVSYEVIVVDNASSDDSVQMVRRDFPDVVLIEAGENLGFGRANNLGMQRANGKYIFLLNSDTVLLNNAIKIFYQKAERILSENRRLGVLGAILLRSDLQTCHSYGRFITASHELRETLAKYFRFLKDSSNTKPHKVTGELPVDYVTGADMFMPRSVFKETGGFDDDFFMYCEEVDWQKRMCQLGMERIIVGGPEIIHLEGGSDTKKKNIWSPSRLRNLAMSRKIYRKKHYNKHILPLVRMLLVLLDAPSLILIALLKKEKRYIELINLK